ncbi:MAG: MFS transporter [Devosia sp.]|uniref:MFS transporter n=1 Tax=Devosia sp. TaxID=1871048 RepID=UPI001ACAE690|nr:MFS transporter [Devosia sp.]MBN9311381.1 MFS transporter [Devosia sp.]MBN9316477.1 MFS transporter [Devosia sp.]
MPFAIYALALAAFAVGSAEFVISGLLPLLADDLAVSIPMAGLLVTAYAAGVAVGGPILTILTSRYSQRTVLIGVMALFTLAQVLCAIAPDYGMLLAARLLSSVAHGTFFGAGNVIVVGLVPPERRGAAFSLFISGITVANLLGLPGGSAIGLNFGWRTTFLIVATIAAVAVAVLVARVPNTRGPGERSATLGAQVRELRHQQVWLSYLTITFVMVGALAFGTYQVPILEQVTRIAPEIVPIYLLVGGLGSVLGIYLGGRGTDWKPMPTLIAVLLLQAFFYFTMLFAMHDKVWMTVNLLITSILGFAFSTPLQARVITAAHSAPNLASSLISTAFNIGIAVGAAIGAILISSGVSYADIPAVGVVSSLCAAGTASLSWWLERRQLATG